MRSRHSSIVFERSRKINEALEIIAQAHERWEAGNKVYTALPMEPGEGDMFDKYVVSYKQWKVLSDELDGVMKTMASAQDDETFNTAFAKLDQIMDAMSPIRKEMDSAMNDIIQGDIKASDEDVKATQTESAEDMILSMIVVAVSISLAALLAFLIIRSITRSITASVTSIRDGAMQITSASDQVASSSSSLAQGASQQASSVEEVSATLEESTAINTQNVDNARQADILAKNANDSARAGYEKGEQLSHSMHAITESAAKISGIIKTIDQIAFQTNLLALNAAVEAARAGEHGLGFAVVADEVRNLAQRAASAAKETSDIIEEVVSQIKEGNQIALATHTSFQEIVEQSKKVSDLIGEISIAGKEQSEGMTQINQAMGQVDQVTQQVAANSEEAAAAAEELNAQATSMMETVRILAAMVGMQNDTQIHAQRKINLKHLDPKPAIVHRAPVQPQRKSLPANKAEDVFPLNEDDLREF